MMHPSPSTFVNEHSAPKQSRLQVEQVPHTDNHTTRPNNDDENDVDLLKRFNPNQAWFGISAFLHYVLSCLVWDDAFKKVNWKSFASTYEQ